MRYAYAITAALLLGGTATAIVLPTAGGAQTAQNEPAVMAAAAPRVGAPLSFADLVAKLQPAVVNISTSQHITQAQPANPFADMLGQMMGKPPSNDGGQPVVRQATSLGSGFIISPDGYVVTNNHVVAAGAKGATVDSITVTLADRKEYVAKLIGRDPTSDLALLKIEAKNMPFVKFGDSDAARVGDWVLAIGNPFGLGGTVTAGIVSSLHRVTGGGAYDRFIQTDAAINQGNSGGPMFDLSGNVIGINSQILGSQGGGNIGIGFAIPAQDAKPVIKALMDGQKIRRGYLGVGVRPIDDDIADALGLQKNEGEIVGTVEPGSPAARAGLQIGDVITQVNGRVVTPDQSLSYVTANLVPGTTVRLTAIRNGKPLSLNATIAERPSEEQLALSQGGSNDDDGIPDSTNEPGVMNSGKDTLGVSVQPLTPQIAKSIGVDSTVQGVVVARVDPASDAGQKLARGDVISAVNNSAVRTAADIVRVIAAAKSAGRSQVLLTVTRGRVSNVFVPVKIGK